MTRTQALALLGVAANANARDVRRAFKRLALAHHPDHNPGDAQATARFVQLCVAYDVLTGARPAAPEVTSSPTPSPKEWVPPWVKRPAPPAPLPTEWADGEPIHYPSPEDIASLGKIEDSRSRRRSALLIVFGPIVVTLGVLAALEAASGRAPASIDSLTRGIRESMGRTWPIRLR